MEGSPSPDTRAAGDVQGPFVAMAVLCNRVDPTDDGTVDVYGIVDGVVITPEGDDPLGLRPAAVLIRAVEPLAGVAGMRRLRAQGRHAHVRVPDARLAAGPGLVGAAFGLDRSHTGLDLCDPRSPIRLEAAPDDDAAQGTR